MANRWSILHVTDLHYHDSSANFLDEDKDATLPQYRELVFPYIKKCFRAFAEANLKFDLIAVCGDLTTKGHSAGFDHFENDFLPGLTPLIRSNGSNRGICLVPGNHDVRWGLDPTRPMTSIKKFEHFKSLVYKTGVTSCYYPESHSGTLNLSAPSGSPIFVDRDRKIVALCINSAMRCGERDTTMQTDVANALKQAKGSGPWIRDVLKKLDKYLVRDISAAITEQIEEIRGQLVSLKTELAADWDSFLKVAILHHHLVHFPGQVTEHKSHELMNDSGKLLSLLADFDFDLVLTGHKHQRYAVRQPIGDKEIILVGGPTIGGYPAADSFRGFRIVDVEDQNGGRLTSISDISYDAGAADTLQGINDAKRNPKKLFRNISPKANFEKRADEIGFSYRSLISITSLSEDGDAARTVDCNDLEIRRKNSERARVHKVSLPATSGYYDCFRASGRYLKVDVDGGISPKVYQENLTPLLKFDPPLGEGPVSYSFKWWTINSFAMDQRQYKAMYRSDSMIRDGVEFTHFIVRDPARELRVVVKFPEGIRVSTPVSVRVMREVADDHPSEWTREYEIEEELRSQHALYFAEAISTAELVVRYPRVGVSYGIEWPVPKTYDFPIQPSIQSLSRHLAGIQHVDQVLYGALRDVMAEAHDGCLRDFNDSLHCSVMRYDHEQGNLQFMFEVEEKQGKGSKLHSKYEHGFLLYGDGIAGRAFKSNRPTGYVRPVTTQEEEPDYYRLIPNRVPHMCMLSLPLCLPVEEKVFKQNNKIYKSREPYGVISLGSKRGRFSLSDLNVKENLARLVVFQHLVNRKMYRALFRGDGMKELKGRTG